jgi:phage tail protein X
MNRYENTPQLKTSTGTRYLSSTVYPEIPYSENDLYVYTTEGDRLDNLAYQFYGDATLYWVIATANPQVSFASLFIPVGTQLRLPGNLNSVLLSFKLLNNLR